MTGSETDEPNELCRICRIGVQQRVYVKNGHDILRCNACGTGRAVARDFDPARYYTGEYFEGGHDDGYADYGGTGAVLRAEFERLSGRLQRIAPTGGDLLEVGCAYGYFLTTAQQHWRVHGLEISADAVARCHAAGLAGVRRGMAEAAELAPLPELQAIVMLDVIEHLPDPEAFLSACRDKLVSGGVLMLTTGDFGSPLARLMGKRWRLMTPPQHLWFFTARGFRVLAARQGWDVLTVEHPTKRVPLSLIRYQLQRMAGLKPRRDAGGGGIGIPVNLGDAMLVALRRPLERAA